jgi:hypothetical protein
VSRKKSDEGLGLQPLERLPGQIAALVGIFALGIELVSVFRFFLGTAGVEGNPIHAFASYLWASLALVVILGLISAWFHHRLGVRVAELRMLEAAIRLQHGIAEEVRLCAADPRSYKWDNAGQKITEFLAERLPGVALSLTVKVTDRGRLRAVFRGGNQDQSQRVGSNDIELNDSHVYRSFRGFARGQKRWVYVRDTDNVSPADRTYAERARACGFRSVVAFPLREPVKPSDLTVTGSMDIAGLLGFWSIDSEQPDAFVDLFRKERLGKNPDNEGKGLRPRADIQAFYGIADCMATILMLRDLAAVEGDGVKS